VNLVPAIDLREGCCVQLLGGAFDRELIRIEDPLEVARSWRSRGATALHVVDLDAAAGHGANAALIEAICGVDAVEVHAGGGLRDDAAVARLLAAGARSALVGTRAVEERAWLGRVAAAHPGQISLAVDVRGDRVTTRGWSATTGHDAVEVMRAAEDLDLFQVVVTAVDVEGAEGGPDLRLAETARRSTDHRLGYAGGVGSASDLTALRDLGIDAVVVGTALYTGALGDGGLFEELQT
jgi:phosphoribosylformimino-5-aminoimidazole carboxamide ribotide isomerase